MKGVVMSKIALFISLDVLRYDDSIKIGQVKLSLSSVEGII